MRETLQVERAGVGLEKGAVELQIFTKQFAQTWHIALAKAFYKRY